MTGPMAASDSQDQERLLQSLAQKSQAELVEILSHLLLAFGREGEAQIQSADSHSLPAGQSDCKSFSEFMEDSIRQHRFPELRRFRVEGRKVFLMFHDREIEITGHMESLGKPGAATAPPAASSQGIKPPAGDKKSSLPARDNVRFKNLEL